MGFSIERKVGCAKLGQRPHSQALKLGGHVRKGENGSLVVYADTFKETGQDESGAYVERDIPFMKGYTVLNVEQIDAFTEHYRDRPAAPIEKMHLIEAAERFFAVSGAVIRHGSNRAFYASGPDLIQLPVPEEFRTLKATRPRRRTS